MRKGLFYISFIVNLLLGLAGLGLHIYSITIMYNIKGILWSIAAFFLPVASEIYLLFYSWGYSGAFLNNYTILLIAYAISAFILKIIVAALMPKEV